MKKDIVIALVAVVIVAAVAFGLAAVRPNLPPTPSAPYRPDAEKKVDKNEKVVMRVNGEPITDREFALYVQAAPAEQRPFYTTPAGRQAIADEIVKLKVLEQEAKRLGITDDAEVRQQIDMARSQIIAARALQKLADQKVDERVRAEYEKEKTNAFTLRHILIAYEGGAVPARGGQKAPSEAEAMKKAQQIAAQLRAGGDFALLAAAHSDDEGSAQNGGILGPMRPETLSQMLPPDIAAAVSRLKPGQTSDPLKTQFGIHIFRIEQPSLQDLEPALRQRVRQQTAEAEIRRLQESAKVERDPQFFPEQSTVPRTTQPGARKSSG